MEINATLIGQFITFAILVWFIKRYVWPPITKAMHDREVKIAAGLEAAERGKRELEMAEHKALDIIREAKAEASNIVDLAHKRSAHIIDEAKETARKDGERIVLNAREEITREISQAKEAMRKQLASLAILGAEKIIQRNLDPAAHAGLLDKFVAEI